VAAAAQRVLTVPNGGLRPGAAWPGTPGVAWTPETSFFALFDAATGQHAQATAAPLSLTDAVVLLTLLAQAGHLPTVPARAPDERR
jgi:hypothetical protein